MVATSTKWLVGSWNVRRAIEELNFILIYFFILNFIYLFLSVLDISCCMGFSLVNKSGGYSLVVVNGPLIAVASLVSEHGL